MPLLMVKGNVGMEGGIGTDTAGGCTFFGILAWTWHLAIPLAWSNNKSYRRNPYLWDFSAVPRGICQAPNFGLILIHKNLALHKYYHIMVSLWLEEEALERVELESLPAMSAERCTGP